MSVVMFICQQKLCLLFCGLTAYFSVARLPLAGLLSAYHNIMYMQVYRVHIMVFQIQQLSHFHVQKSPMQSVGLHESLN